MLLSFFARIYIDHCVVIHMITHIRRKAEHIKDVTQGRASEVTIEALLLEFVRGDNEVDIIIAGQLGSYLFKGLVVELDLTVEPRGIVGRRNGMLGEGEGLPIHEHTAAGFHREVGIASVDPHLAVTENNGGSRLIAVVTYIKGRAETGDGHAVGVDHEWMLGITCHFKEGFAVNGHLAFAVREVIAHGGLGIEGEGCAVRKGDTAVLAHTRRNNDVTNWII